MIVIDKDVMVPAGYVVIAQDVRGR